MLNCIFCILIKLLLAGIWFVVLVFTHSSVNKSAERVLLSVPYFAASQHCEADDIIILTLLSERCSRNPDSSDQSSIPHCLVGPCKLSGI